MSRPKGKLITPGDGDARHGTLTGYIGHGCRCPQCAAAMSLGNGNAPPGHLLGLCWCEATFVAVLTADVRRGLTGSCGADGCEAQRLAS